MSQVANFEKINQSQESGVEAPKTNQADGPKELEKGLPYYDATGKGDFRINIPEGRFGRTSINVKLLTPDDKHEIDELFRLILEGPDKLAEEKGPEIASEIRAAQNNEEQAEVAEKAHDIVSLANKKAIGISSFRELKNFFSRLLNSNDIMGAMSTPRIARVEDPGFIQEQFPMILKSNEGNELYQNAPSAQISEVFVISQADGEKLKEILRSCGKADETAGLGSNESSGIEDEKEEKLVVKVRGARFAFLFHDAPVMSPIANLADKRNNQEKQDESDTLEKAV